MSEKKRFSYTASEVFGNNNDGFDDDINTEGSSDETAFGDEPQTRSRREREFDEAAERRAARLRQYTMKRDCENEYYNTYGYSRRTARPRYAAAVPDDATAADAAPVPVSPAAPASVPTDSPINAAASAAEIADDFDDFGDAASAEAPAAPLMGAPEDGGVYNIDGEEAMFDLPEQSDNKDFPIPEQVPRDRAGAIITVIIVLLLIAFMFVEAVRYFPQFDRGLHSCVRELISGEPDSFEGNAFVSDSDSMFSY